MTIHRIYDLSTGHTSIGVQTGNSLVTNDNKTYTRMGNHMVGTDGNLLLKTGPYWMNSQTGGLSRIDDDDDSY